MRTILLFILLILVLSYSIAQKSVYIYANLAGGAFNEKKNFRVTEKPSGVSTPITSINSRLGGDIGIGFRLTRKPSQSSLLRVRRNFLDRALSGAQRGL